MSCGSVPKPLAVISIGRIVTGSFSGKGIEGLGGIGGNGATGGLGLDPVSGFGINVGFEIGGAG